MKKISPILIFPSILLVLSLFIFSGTALAEVSGAVDGGTLTTTDTGWRIDGPGNVSFDGKYDLNAGQTLDIYALNAILRDMSGIATIANGIYTLYGTGTLAMINPAGIIFGSSAQVNAANIIVSTLNISNADFFEGCRTGNFKFIGQGAYIINHGKLIPQPGGYVCLLSQAIANTGTIQAKYVIVASGEEMRLSLDDKSVISVQIDKAVASEIFGPDGQKMQSAIENSGTISANGGTVTLTAKSLNKVFDYAINNSGIIEAKAINDANGEIALSAEGAPILNTGTIEASKITITAPDTSFINYGKLISEGSQPGTGEIDIKALEVLQGGLIFAERLINIDAGSLLTAPGIIDPVGPNPVGPIIVLNPTLPFPIPEAIIPVIRAPTVTIRANTIGSYEYPVNIDAGLTYIYKTAGDINILESLGIGTSILLRGPPGSDFSIIYSKDSNLTLNAENVNVVGSGPLYLYGNMTFYNFSCTIPDKEIFFEAGHTYTFKGFLNIKGSLFPEQPIRLYSQTEGSFWYLDIQADVPLIDFVAVRDCYSLHSFEIPVGVDCGNNVNLSVDPLWTGNSAVVNPDGSRNWSDSANWYGGWPFNGHKPPTGTEAISFLGTLFGLNPNGNRDCYIDNIGTWFGGSFTIIGYTGTITLGVPITTGDFIQASGTFNCGLNAMTVNGLFLQTGGTFTAPSSIMTVSGNFIRNGGTFDHNSGTIVFNGTTTVSGSSATTFNNVTITGALTGHAANMNVAGNWTNNGTFNAQHGTVTFTGTGLHTILTGGSSLYNAVFSNAGGTWILQDTLNAGGNITITLGTLDVNGNPVIVTGAFANNGGTVTTAVGDINITANSIKTGTITNTSPAGDIHLTATGGDILLDNVTASGKVHITVSGAIIDDNGSLMNISALGALLSAVNGIGSGNPIETQVSNLQATNTTSGSIEIHNFGALTLDDVSGTLGYSIYNPADGVHIWASSPLTVNSKVEARGLIKLEAKGGSSGDLTVNARIYSINNRIVLNASNDIIINENGEVVTNGKDIDIEAGRDVYVHGISTDGSFTNPTPPSLGVVTIIAGRNIQDGYDTNPPLDKTGLTYIYDISAYKIVLTAGGDISTGALAPIEIRSQELEMTAGGDVNLFHKGTLHLNGFTGNSSGSNFAFINSGDLYIDSPINVYGEVNITVIDDPDMYVNAPINSNGADVTLSATRNIIHSFNGDVFTGGGKFTGKADSDKNQDGFYDIQFGAEINTTGPGGDGEVVISADDFNLSGIIDAGTANVQLKPSDGQKIALASQASFGRFRVSNDELNNIITSGLIIIGSHQAGDITINNLDQAGRDIKLVTGGNVLEQGDEPSADITVGTLIFDVDGDVGTILNGIETITDAVEGKVGGLVHIIEFGNLNINVLKAQNAILEAWRIFALQGNIIGNNVGGPNLIADSAILDAADGINIDTKVDSLSARVRESDATGDIKVENTGALALNDLAGWGYSVRNFGKGNIDISTASPITINADVIARRAITLTANGAGNGDIIINANIQSIGGNQKDINLNAGRHIIHNSGTVSTDATVNETAGKDIEMYGTSEVLAGIANINAGRNLKMWDHSSISADDVNITAGKNVVMHNHAAITGITITINAVNKVVMKNHSEISATDTVNITALYMGMHGNTLVHAGNLVDINVSGDFEMFDSSDITSDVDVQIDAGGHVIVSNSTITAGNDVNVNAVGNIFLGVINAGHSITLNTTAGDIVDTNGGAVNLTAPNLYMDAFGSIGAGGDYIDTDVDDIWLAIARNGNVYISEADGVNLWDIEAYGGSTIDIITGGDTYAYKVYAEGNGAGIPAVINILVTSGDLIVQANGATPSSICAHQLGSGLASISLTTALGNIIIKEQSLIKAEINVNGTSTVSITASSGGITVTNSSVEALVNGTATSAAAITIAANNDLTIDPSSIIASVQRGTASVSMTSATGSIIVDNSIIRALVTNNGFTNSTASITMNANVNINVINNSLVNAYVDSRGASNINITAGQNVFVTDSNITASTGGIGAGPAISITANGGDVNVNNSTVSVTANNLTGAVITIIASLNVNITNGSLITASANNIDAVTINITANGGDVNVNNSTVSANANNVAFVTINITANQNVNLVNGANINVNANNFSLVTINITANNADVNVTNSSVSATGNNIASAAINITADQNVIVTSSTVTSRINNIGPATINITATNANLAITTSTIQALTGTGNASINTYSNNDTIITDSDILASVTGNGSAVINITADGSVTITNTAANTSFIRAIVTGDGSSSITINANGGDVTIHNGTITAQVDGLTAGNTATITIYALNAVAIDPTHILAQVVNGTAAIIITANNDDVTVASSTITANVTQDGAAIISINANSANIVVTSSAITANITGNGSAIITTYSKLNTTITDSDILASVTGNGSAAIIITSDGSVTITNTAENTNYVKAIVTGDGSSSITINANGGDVTIHNGTITAQVDGFTPGNTSNITIYADQAVSIDPTHILAQVINGFAGVSITANNSTLDITSSVIQALVTGMGTSIVSTYSNTDTTITNSDILASVAQNGLAMVSINADGGIAIINAAANTNFIRALVVGDGISINSITANGDVTVSNGTIEAVVSGSTPGNAAFVIIFAQGNIFVDPTLIMASVINGTATINIVANTGDISILDSLVRSLVSGNGDAVVFLQAVSGAVGVTNSVLRTDVAGDGNAQTQIGANGNITLANSLIMALVGGIGIPEANLLSYGSIFADALSEIRAQYAGLLARFDIGTLISPIRTTVENLSAYSWDTGSIYILESDDINLGYINSGIGASVAANNGIIHIVSGMNMFVNSVIAPRGGVYLESTAGSIYAGTGWCPSTAAPVILGPHTGPDFLNSLAAASLMSLIGTEWNAIGGLVNFSAVMTPLPLVAGPNVIAGGYSYFSAPTGTIGVGTPGTPDVTHPIMVNIQVIAGSTSAVPAGFIPSAGLTLRVGGGAGSYDAGNGNGTLPICAVIQGIVRPATTAITGVYPAFGLDLSTIPPGYVLYVDSDANICTGAMFAPSAVNTGILQQIWPPLPRSTGFFDFLLLLEELTRQRENAIYEIMQGFTQVTMVNPHIQYFYFYHPLTPVDMVAFDNIALDANAYEFIESNLLLDLKKKHLSPYYGI